MAKHKFASMSLTVQDRAISSKFLTPRVSEKCTLGNFQKIFPSPKMAAILNFRIFCQKWQNTNLLLSPEPCKIERFRRNFQPAGYLSNVLLAIFMSADIMSSLCGVGARVRVCVRVNNFSSKTTRPRDVLFF